MVDGGISIDEINDEINLEIPEGRYETLAGFIIDRLQTIPEINARTNFRGSRFTISEINKNKIALIDCNSFYVSCERLFNPKINNKPVVVLSNNDGCVISRSTEAKKIGIKMGEPYFKVKELVKKNKVNIFSSNYALYGDLSINSFSYFFSIIFYFFF